MFLMKFRLIIALLIFSSYSAAFSQDIVDLDQLISMALEKNYQIRLSNNRLLMAENNNTIGNAGFLPSVAFSGEQSWGIDNSESTYVFGDSITADNARSSAFNMLAQVNWTVFDGFKMFARKDRLGLLYNLGKLDTRFYIEQTTSDLARAYYRLISERSLLDSYQASLDISRYRLKLEKNKMEIGAGTALLYHQAVIDFNTDSAILVNQQLLIDNLVLDLNRITGRDPINQLIPSGKEMDFSGNLNTDSLIVLAVNHNQDIEEAKLQELLAETTERIESGDLYPEISLYGNYSYATQSSESGFIRERRSSGLEYGVRFRFNLYNGGREKIQVSNARINEINASINTEDVQNQIRTNMLKLINRRQSSISQLNLIENSLKAAEKSMEIADLQLENGSINGFEFRQAQLSQLNVKRRFTELTYSVKAIETDIYRLAGTLLEKLYP